MLKEYLDTIKDYTDEIILTQPTEVNLMGVNLTITDNDIYYYELVGANEYLTAEYKGYKYELESINYGEIVYKFNGKKVDKEEFDKQFKDFISDIRQCY